MLNGPEVLIKLMTFIIRVIIADRKKHDYAGVPYSSVPYLLGSMIVTAKIHLVFYRYLQIQHLL